MYTDQIKIKKLENQDLNYRVSLLNNKDIQPFINTHEKFTIDKTNKWFAAASQDETRVDLVILLGSERVGMCGLVNISKIDNNAELYIYLDPSYQGQGIGSHALNMVCDVGFNTLGLHKIYLYTFADNKRANHLYEKNGFKKEGHLREHTFKNGRLCDRNIYSRINN